MFYSFSTPKVTRNAIEDGNKKLDLHLNSTSTIIPLINIKSPANNTLINSPVHVNPFCIEDDYGIEEFSLEFSDEMSRYDNFEKQEYLSQIDLFDEEINEQSRKYKQLYLSLFLHQTHSNLPDSDIVIQAKTHALIHKDDEIPQAYATLKKKGRIFQPIIYKYLYLKCGLLKPITAAQVTSDEPIFCGRICNCKIIPSQEMKSYFCYIRLVDYLQNIIPKIINLLRFNPLLPSDQPADVIRDIVDGSIYRQLAGMDTIVIYFGFDGVQYCEKSKKSIWPLVLYICELPFNLRQKFAFPIAIHSGEKQPSTAMLEPFINELRQYLHKPIEIVVKEKGQIVRKKFFVKLLLGICDAPARAKVLQMKQHNGYYGCNYCKILVTPHHDLNCMVYPMNVTSELRTNQEWRSLAEKTLQTKITKANELEFLGIKGYTPLLKLPYIDIVSFCVPEIMHSQFLGTARLLIDFWLGLRSTEEVLNSEILNRRLKRLKFPSKFLRVMPDITKPLKSIELENLLFYGFVLFEGLLPEREFNNFKLLSLIISTLSSREITHAQIDKCEELIAEFINEFGTLYPTELHKYNVHMLSHLPQVVRQFGPLIVCSSYQVSFLSSLI